MEEFRILVNSSNLNGTGSSTASNVSVTSTSSSEDKVAAEFQARQNRHRDSMARKSQQQIEHMKASSEITQHKAFSDPRTTVVVGDDEQMLQSTASQNESKSSSTGTANGGIWCDVSSPMKTEEGEVVDVVVVDGVSANKTTCKDEQVVEVVSSVKAAVAAIQQKAISTTASEEHQPKVTAKAQTNHMSSNNGASKASTKTGSRTTHTKTVTATKTASSSQPHSIHADASTAAPAKKGLFSGMSMFGSKKTISHSTAIATTAVAAPQPAVVVPIVSPIVDHQSPSIIATTPVDDSPSSSVPLATELDSKSKNQLVASTIANSTVDVTATSDAVPVLKTLTVASVDGNKKDGIKVTTTSNAPTTTLASSSSSTTASSTSSLKLKDAFASKNLITSIVSNYNAVLASPTPLLQSASAPTLPVPSVNTIDTSASGVVMPALLPEPPSAHVVVTSATSWSDTANSSIQLTNDPSTIEEEEYIIEDR